MSLGKSIEKRIPGIIYVLVLLNLVVLVFSFLLPSEIAKLILLTDLFLHIFVTAVFINIKKIDFIIKVFSCSAFFYLLLALFFRNIRSIFPNVGRDKSIVGFAQYFNYPIYFDIFLLLIILIIPFTAYLIIKKLKK